MFGNVGTSILYRGMRISKWCKVSIKVNRLCGEQKTHSKLSRKPSLSPDQLLTGCKPATREIVQWYESSINCILVSEVAIKSGCKQWYTTMEARGATVN